MATRDADLPARRALPVTIVIPAYGAAPHLRVCLASLVKYAPTGCEIVVADDATPDDSIADVTREFAAQWSVSYVRRETNLGFVENCNEAIRAALPSGNDILLLNSDTEVTEGFLEEMWDVLHLHEKHGAVSPRSNNATIFSVPVSGGLTPSLAFQLWQSIRPLLPRYQIMPTGVGFCLLVKNAVLRQLGVFDPAYSPGYNEENDLICRMNRHGYSAVAAHRAFVYHHESASFGSGKRALEERNRQLLAERYPEYPRKVEQHMRYAVDPVDRFAPLWLDRRKRILIDLFHLPGKHCGTSEFALNLLLHLAPRLDERYELTVGVSRTAREFFGPELVGYRIYDPRLTPGPFDLVFKPCQLFTWQELRRMVSLGGRLAYTLLDIIAVRCDYLSGPNARMLFKTSADMADRVLTISEFSKRDFMAFYGAETSIDVIYPGTFETRTADGRGKHVLVVGNSFHHKAVLRAVRALEGIGDIIVLGGDQALDRHARWLASGHLSRAELGDLYDRAAVLVYPSFYEGFGMPVLDALARGIPVVALDSTVNRELQSLTGSDEVFLVQEHSEMRAIVARLLNGWAGRAGTARVRTWQDTADEYAQSFDDLLARDLDIGLLRRRWELMTMIDAVHPLEYE
jgi:GT2 family glycosyltransferase/glycosyltransferase involved in cell wall biosynthesis